MEARVAPLVRAAVLAVRQAAALAVRVQQTMVAADAVTKKDSSPVTVADYGVQAVVASSLITQLTPLGLPFKLLAEEDGATLRAADRALGESVAAAVRECLAGASWDGGAAARQLGGATVTVDGIAAAIDAGKFEFPATAAAAATAPAAASPSTPTPPAAASLEYFILDPIDGTKGFLRHGQYAVGLAYVAEGRPVMAVVGCPNLPFPAWPPAAAAGSASAAAAATPASASAAASSAGSDSDRGVLFVAVEGGGAFMERLFDDDASAADAGTAAAAAAAAASTATGGSGGSSSCAPPFGLPASASRARIRVAPLASPAGAVLCESFDPSHSDHGVTGALSARLGLAGAPIRIDSMCKYGLLARGDGHVYLRFPRRGYRENVWDHAPGVVLLQEAGGRVTDARGKPLDFSTGAALAGNVGVVATNGALHDAVIAAIADAGVDLA